MTAIKPGTLISVGDDGKPKPVEPGEAIVGIAGIAGELVIKHPRLSTTPILSGFEHYLPPPDLARSGFAKRAEEMSRDFMVRGTVRDLIQELRESLDFEDDGSIGTTRFVGNTLPAAVSRELIFDYIGSAYAKHEGEKVRSVAEFREIILTQVAKDLAARFAQPNFGGDVTFVDDKGNFKGRITNVDWGGPLPPVDDRTPFLKAIDEVDK